MNVWIAVIAAGVLSYLLRVGPVMLLGRIDGPTWTERAGDLIGPVAFAALAGSALASTVFGAASLPPAALTASAPKIIAAVAAAVIAHRFRSPLAAVGIGMVVMLGLKAIL
jgi:branched-subunit amino acid transport protein